MQVPIDVFISYAPEDDDLRKEFEQHLAPLKRDGVIRAWHQRLVAARRRDLRRAVAQLGQLGLEGEEDRDVAARQERRLVVTRAGREPWTPRTLTRTGQASVAASTTAGCASSPGVSRARQARASACSPNGPARACASSCERTSARVTRTYHAPPLRALDAQLGPARFDVGARGLSYTANACSRGPRAPFAPKLAF